MSVDVVSPLLVAFEYPFSEPFFVFVKGEVPVGGLLEYGLGAADGAGGVDEFFGREV